VFSYYTLLLSCPTNLIKDENIVYEIGDTILASRFDNFIYPATVLRVININETLFYEVKFEDGVKKMICSKAYDLNDVVNVKPIEEDNTEEPPPSTESSSKKKQYVYFFMYTNK